MKHYQTAPRATCPTCGYVMDCQTSVSTPQRPPTPGDIAVCLKCGEALVFGKDLILTAATLNDLLPLFPAERIRLGRAQKIIREKRFLDKKP